MRLSQLENEVGAQYQSIAAVVPESIGRFASAPTETLKSLVPSTNEVLKSAIAMTIASVGAVMLGSVLRGHRASAGIEVMTDSIPWLRSRRFRRGRAAEALRAGAIGGSLVLGSVLLAGLEGAIGDKLTKSRVGRGLLTSFSAFGLDRLLLGPRCLEAMTRFLGRSGVALTYGAVGAAYALASSSESPPERDPSGGDIAAGVPAM